MANEVNTNDELRAQYESGKLRGAELVNALVVLFGYDRETAELIVSEEYLPTEDGGITSTP